MSLFRIVRPLFRPQAIPGLQRPGLSCTFFQPNAATGLNTDASRILGPQFVPQRFYGSPVNRKGSLTRKPTPKSSNIARQVPKSFPPHEPIKDGAYDTPREFTFADGKVTMTPREADQIVANERARWEREERLKKTCIYGFIGVNIAVFLYANYLRLQAKQNGDAKDFIGFMHNMTLSLRGFFDEHRFWTPLTSMFSHIAPMHILGNLVAFYFLSDLLRVTPGITARAFATLVLGSGLMGGLGWMLTTYRKTKTTQSNHRSLGFSGAVSGVTIVAAALYPKVEMLLLGFIPVPLWLLAGGYLVYDGFYLSANDGVAHSGHLGGMLFGALYYLLRLRTRAFPML